METSIIKIGNSKGLRLSKTILEKYHIKDKVELILEKGQIILRPIDSPRKNWEEKFKEMAKNEDDQLLMNDVLLHNPLKADRRSVSKRTLFF